MNHGHKGRKFNRNCAQRKSLLRNLAKSLIIHEHINTTIFKAKDIRPIVEKIVTLGKTDNLHNRRRLISSLGGDIAVAKKVFDVLGKRYYDRKGGYLRIVKTGFRKGDAAPMSIIQFV